MKTAKISASRGVEPPMGGAGYTPDETGGEATSPAVAEGGKSVETDTTNAVPMIGEIRYAPPSGRNGNRLPTGAHPWNTGGKLGRSDRLSAHLGMFLKELREREDFQNALRKIARNPRARNFPALLKLMAQYDEGRPAVKHETYGQQEIVVRFEREGRRLTRG